MLCMGSAAGSISWHVLMPIAKYGQICYDHLFVVIDIVCVTQHPR